jgi:Zn-dependent M28 family amino/carboxypeptidase
MASDALAAVSAERMKTIVGILAQRSFAGRRVASAGGEAARAWLAESLLDLGADVDVDEFNVPGYPAPAANLYASWPGTNQNSVKVLLTAHYDGVGDTEHFHRPGAADNAAGVAVVLEAARLLTGNGSESFGLSVALLDGEEIGAVGSARHAARLAEANRTPWVINVDGAGELHEAVAVEAGGAAHPILAALDAAGRSTGVALRAGQVASDNGRYAAAGFATVGLGAGMHGYHTEHDTAEYVQPETLSAMARLVVATVAELAAHESANADNELETAR